MIGINFPDKLETNEEQFHQVNLVYKHPSQKLYSIMEIMQIEKITLVQCLNALHLLGSILSKLNKEKIYFGRDLNGILVRSKQHTKRVFTKRI